VAAGLGVGVIVLLVRRMLRGHKPSEVELRRLELERQEPVETLMLPTLTTEMTGKVARDPDYELEAQKLRQRGMGW
jgi:hypothetical protein